jgi:alpha-methylacyl-CoA racemase
MASGPLSGLRVLEMGGIGPGPFCAMLLADLGADVIRIDRTTPPWSAADARFQVLLRGRRSVLVDLKRPEGVAAVLDLMERADALLEGFRPGVMESLGLGPEVCLERNPRLVYGRMTGWGQEGPLAQAAGHDINYIALVGALHAIGPAGGDPVPPLNLIGDFGGGGMLLAFGMACALIEAQRSGRGQVVDAAMVDGAATLMAMFYGYFATGRWLDERGVNAIDGGSHYYNAYRTADDKWVAVGSIEPRFYGQLLERIGVTDKEFEAQMDRDRWPELREKLARVFASKRRDEWCALLEGSDACFAPVLSIEESFRHPHNLQRELFTEIEGVTQPAPSPRFSRTPGAIQGPSPAPGQHTASALADWGIGRDRIQALLEDGVILDAASKTAPSDSEKTAESGKESVHD